jgi:hypothetical protein
LIEHVSAVEQEKEAARLRLLTSLSRILNDQSRLVMFSALPQWRSFVVTQKQDDSDVNFVVRMYKRF